MIWKTKGHMKEKMNNTWKEELKQRWKEHAKGNAKRNEKRNETKTETKTENKNLNRQVKLLYFEWSPPWHFKTACWHNFCLKLLSRHFGPTNYPNHLFHLAGHCACQSVKQDINISGILSGTLSDVLSGILIWHSYLAFLSGILLWHSIWHSIWHSYLAFLSGILLWHSIWHSIWRSIWHSIWHIFWHSLQAVEVRQGTLGVDSRGWGPAGNTWRGFSPLRSGREHLAWMVVVEVRRRRKAGEGGSQLT